MGRVSVACHSASLTLGQRHARGPGVVWVGIVAKRDGASVAWSKMSPNPEGALAWLEPRQRGLIGGGWSLAREGSSEPGQRGVARRQRGRQVERGVVSSSLSREGSPGRASPERGRLVESLPGSTERCVCVCVCVCVFVCVCSPSTCTLPRNTIYIIYTWA